MKRILLSAFACEPGKGSEEGIGWNWSTGLANLGYEVHCLTREVNRKLIETHENPASLYFHYVPMPFRLEFLFGHSTACMYLYYMIWQWQSYKAGKLLHKQLHFDIAHHVTWGSLQMGSYLYKLNTPFIFGPAGGGQKAPEAFNTYFRNHWPAELKREKVSNFLVKYSPAFKQMVKKARAVLVSNPDTLHLAEATGAKNAHLEIDVALASDFFPEKDDVKNPLAGSLKLLWVGRLMPRKAVLLLLEVMKELKMYENITLTIVGDGEMKAEVLDKIKKEGLENSVYLTGKIPFEEVRSYYSSRDIFFFTSLRDSCPHQLMEAMAFGMPVITLNLHGQALLVNDKTGIRCKCDTPIMAIEELKKAVISLYNNPDRVRELSAEAFKFAKKHTCPKKSRKLRIDIILHNRQNET